MTVLNGYWLIERIIRYCMDSGSVDVSLLLDWEVTNWSVLVDSLKGGSSLAWWLFAGMVTHGIDNDSMHE